MAGPIAVLIMLARLVITIYVKIFLFLIKRFDITNGLIVALWVAIFAQDIEINIWLRITILVLIVLVCFLLQHFVRPTRIIFGIISSLFGGLIAYGIFQDNEKISPYIPMAIAIVIVAILNWFSWIRLDYKDEDDK